MAVGVATMAYNFPESEKNQMRVRKSDNRYDLFPAQEPFLSVETNIRDPCPILEK